MISIYNVTGSSSILQLNNTIMKLSDEYTSLKQKTVDFECLKSRLMAAYKEEFEGSLI